ncbi:AAA family ATPase [Acetatifactor aquisgranensis]|uniref:AAA family ATPase n=1 Tax=Acetatifactor aquisgranensis TaxID=2941233 RepID=UPI00203F7CCB|nr:AAA family ATPase [Acetatifactor aquisgranensis]
MGNYLNARTAYDAYRRECGSPYFVDKSLLLDELIQRMETTANYICITRPRRFGKSVAANMIACFFSRECRAEDIFDRLRIAQTDSYRSNVGKHDVIFISFNELPRKCRNYEEYIDRISDRLLEDLRNAYPKAGIHEKDAVWDALLSVYQAYDSKRFIFVLDEWDFIFHRNFVTDRDKADYIDFLSNLLKGKAYVSLAYMTGILPIAKYSSGSELNMFLEYSMTAREKFGEYFGFTEEETDDLYQRYLVLEASPKVSREGLRFWYDGYQTASGKRLYNPRSVVGALSDNQLGSYWTSSGPYDEIFYYIGANVDAVRDSLAFMVSGTPVPAKVQEYAATSMRLSTRDEIFSAMVVYGFLSYENGCVRIPNKELMEKFDDMLLKEPSLGYVNRLAEISSQMLRATLGADTDKMSEILEFAHNTETPLLAYNHEAELTAIVNLVYLAARDSYRIEREDKAGTGYVDFIFYPETDSRADGIVLELKAGHTPEEALRQIRDRKYALKFEGKIGEKRQYAGRILGVGIAYDRDTKVHSCKVDVLRDALKTDR